MKRKEVEELIARIRTKGNYVGDYYMGFTDSATVFNHDIDILAAALMREVEAEERLDMIPIGKEIIDEDSN